jgi:hypothetical protein
VLLQESTRQVGRDGGHAERSTHYHRYALDFYNLALLTAELNSDDDAADTFRDVVRRMARYQLAIAGTDGRTQQIGDDDGGSLWPFLGRDPKDVRDTLAVSAIALDEPALAPWGVPEEALWITWSTHGSTVVPCRVSGGEARLHTDAFPDTGYVVVRDRDDMHLVFDVGAHGYLNGGHAHADALAVTIEAAGRPLLVDPGTATYTMDAALRDRMRSSVSHNTLTLDGEPPSMPRGPFHWRTRTDATLEASRSNEGMAWAEASHHGYAGLCHRRDIVCAAGGGTLIVDQITGRDRHTAQLHWHFDPAWRVTCDADSARRLRATHEDGTVAWLLRDGGSLSLVRGDGDTGLGWCSPRYGIMMPTWTARVTEAAVAPFAMATWVGSGGNAPSLERLVPETDRTGDTIAVRVTQDETAWTTMVRPGEPAARPTRSCTVGDYHTNARMLQYATRGDVLLYVAVADAAHVLSLRDGLISIAADDYVDDLTVALRHGVLELVASRPLGRIHLQGTPLTGVTAARVNGRELPRRMRGTRRDSLLVPASSWPDRDSTPEPAASARRIQAGQTICAE